MDVYWFQTEKFPLTLNLFATVEESERRFQVIFILLHVKSCLDEAPAICHRF